MRKLLAGAAFIFYSSFSFAQADIAAARAMGENATVTVTGIVTSGSELGVIRYIQDPTAGLAVYSSSLSAVNRGDSITLTGVLKDYNGLLEVDPVSSFTVLSTGNPLPTPQIITPLQMNETTEGELVQIDNTIFGAGCSNFLGNTAYSFTSNGESGKSYVKTGSPLVGGLVPIGAISVVGISSQFTYSNPANDGYQLLPRDVSDLGGGGAINFTSCVLQSNITSTSFDLSWSTDSAGSTNVRYGITSALEIGDINQGGSTASHSLSMTGLTSATIYYIMAYSVLGTDTTFSGIGLYSTISTSSGDIKVYFNNSVDLTVSSGTNAIELSGTFNDTISAYIGRAQNTIDFSIYNNNNSMIVDSINAAYARGVEIRYVTESDVANIGLSNMNAGIGRIDRNTGPGNGIMHNKFVVIDRDDADNSYVITGSTNWTPGNLFTDYNNMIIIQDQAIAKCFTLEFEEMFGSTGLMPNTSLAKFGAAKEDNTPHNFIVGGNPMEVYFSPSDQTTSYIIDAMDATDYSLYFCILAFTKDEIRDAVKAAHDGFQVDVKGAIETTSGSGTEYDTLVAYGVDVQSHAGVSNVLHHKYAIIDQGVAGADPMVFTGSHNWSSSAESKNDENTVFVHNQEVANQYYQEFMARYCELATCGGGPLAPVALFSASKSEGTVVFTDLSSNTPTSWSWDFGNGNQSNNQNPTHTFTVIDSSYNVCLTATNAVGSHIYCDSVMVTTGIDDQITRTAFSVYPNPSVGEFNLEFTLKSAKKANIRVMDITAKVLHNKVVDAHAGANVIAIATDLNAGQYILELTIDGVSSFLPLIIE